MKQTTILPRLAVLCLSGGLDSVTLLDYLLGQNIRVHAALFDYGQKHKKELECAKWHCQRTETLFTEIKVPDLCGSRLTDGGGSWVVPNRNAIIISHAVNLASTMSADMVAIGCNADDAGEFPDCRPEFIEAYNALLRAAKIDIEIITPFINKGKWWIGGLAREMGTPIHQIWSCYVGEEKPCGTCPACLKLSAALK